jgi:glycosyltransferase involved in cell wall biosynthesis
MVKRRKVNLIKSDIFTLPTYTECFPLSIVEAMQASLPVISTDEGAIPDIVDDNETGFIVNKKDPEDLADKLKILIEDKDLRLKMGQRGREKFLNNYTFEIFEKNMDQVFKKVIDNATANSKA